jgi:flavin-dependent dehydrogenase
VAWPAGTARLAAPVGPGWVAAGDAAVTFDPLSSQGVLSALLLGRDAGRALLDPAFDHRIRWEQVVRRYARERAHWYATETRFAGSRFWSRRHTAPAV